MPCDRPCIFVRNPNGSGYAAPLCKSPEAEWAEGSRGTRDGYRFELHNCELEDDDAP